MRDTLTISITRLRGSTCYSLELSEFYPVDGFDAFLEAFCDFIDERFIAWDESEESGIGRITFKRRELPVYWSASAMSFCFHCQSATEAGEMRALVIAYLDEYPEALD